MVFAYASKVLHYGVHHRGGGSHILCNKCNKREMDLAQQFDYYDKNREKNATKMQETIKTRTSAEILESDTTEFLAV